MFTALRNYFGLTNAAGESFGDKGEQEAKRFLKRKRYKIVASGFRVRQGEIDLIAVDQDTVVFVEVKTRKTTHHGQPHDAVDQKKQLRICRAAQVFLQRHDLLGHRSRFDVVSIVWPEQGKPEITHFERAFESMIDPTGYS